jgi:hypothetical protein
MPVACELLRSVTMYGAIDLTWTAPSGCPALVEVESAVARLVGADRVPGERDSVVVRGVVREIRGQYRVSLETHDGDARSVREVVAPTCALATDAATVVIAMLVPRAEPAVAIEQPDRTPAPLDSDESAARATAPATRRSIWLGVGAVADAGTLPSATPGLAASIAWRASSKVELRAELGTTTASHASARTTLDGRTLGGDLQLWRAGARGELALGALGATAGLDAGILHGRGTGANSPAAANAFWVAACAGPLVRWSVGERLAMRAGLEVVVPFTRPAFRIDNDDIHTPSAVGARGTVSAEVGF